MLKNRIDLTKKIKENKTEGMTSNWNRSANFKLNTLNNENYLLKNKFIKSTPLRDKLIGDKNNNNRIILPDIKTPNLHREPVNLNVNNNISYFAKSPQDLFRKHNNELYSDKTNFFKNIKLNNVVNTNTNSNYLSEITQTTTIATNSTKKFISSKINGIQNINEDSSHYGMNLIPGGSTTNNKIIIPMLTIRRPASNFNIGGEAALQNLNEKDSNIRMNKKTDNIENNNELFQIGNYKNIRNKICKSQEIKGRFNASMKNKEIYNLFPGMQKLISPNFHKIKIEKGMTNINLGNSLNKKKTLDFSNNNYDILENKLKKIL